AWESLFLEESTPSPEIARDRLSLLDDLGAGRAAGAVIVSPVQALAQPVPSAEALLGARTHLARGDDRGPAHLARLLVDRGYRRATIVAEPGEFSLRGDVLDVFPYARLRPLRLEFFGDALESIREFDAESQRSVAGGERAECDLLLPAQEEFFRECFRPGDPLLLDHLPAGSAVFIKEPEAVEDRIRKVLHNILGEASQERAALFLDRVEQRAPLRVGAFLAPGDADRHARASFGSVERFESGDLDALFGSLASSLHSGSRLRVYCESAAESRRFGEMLADHGLGGAGGLEVRVGRLRAGFEILALRLAILTTRELFRRRLVRRPRQRAAAGSRAIQSFLDLERGDYVVHLVHGIARYLGMESLVKGGVEQEFLVLLFRGDVRVYVPVSKIDLVQKYVGSGDRVPVLDRVGGSAWERKKDAVEKALFDLASDLLEIQALRQEKPGIAYPRDSEWQRQFEASFPFHDTPDQIDVTDAIKRDMETSRPMDRLVCGDVGYGKTELAMRAAFKAVDAGRQVAVLVPTTVLAEQHFCTFRERMAEFPVSVDVLSRFRSPAQQRGIIERAASGALDILIGTHRLLSEDVRFRNLGVVIIDEEQRFGVAHKEKLKQLRTEVDVITLSATPIPRTLHMALLGIRDISSLTTPPEGRIPIHTEICRFDRRKIREIIIRELNRDGQVLVIHNRILDIEVIRREVEACAPEARVAAGHGQMKGHDLEEIMQRFMRRQIDVLVATTIIENGIDIPTANTIMINEADRYGLADLHQLRGRVGRYKHQAYCYLLLPDHRHVQPEAQKRLQALVEFSGLGSGFQIAMRDLEIRGAGNILGKEQSGHIAAVGYDMYCRLLEKCVKSLKNERYSEPVRVEVDLALGACIPEEYLPGEAVKLQLYRRISQLRSEEAVEDMAAELRDRYGEYPPEVQRLLDLQTFRLACTRCGVESVERDDDGIVLRGTEAMRPLLESCPRRVVVLDPRTVVIPLAGRRTRASAGESDERAFEWLRRWIQDGVRREEALAPKDLARSGSLGP
ncbi:MAG: transcription-repair coupling factor, partial [Planctomycetes bacterium]|nr:transcription-repair coupling factor [Planctomycetota bacterium]